MTGLEKIVNQIKADAEATCERILAQSAEKCSAISDAAHENVADIKAAGEVKARDCYDRIIARANSAAEIEQRKILLTARQKAVSDAVAYARNQLLHLSDNEYFDLIFKLISTYSLEGDGEISFNSNDLSRLPESFLSTANSFAKGNLSLSSEAVDIDGGFVLSYGGIDVNCSFKSLFSDNSEKISDAVAGILFT